MVTLKDVSNFFKTFDLFGETFTFKSKKRKTYNRLLGGLTSFIFIVYTFYYLVFSFSALLKKNSRTTDISHNLLGHNSVNLKEHKDFIFFICLRNNEMKSDFFLYDNLKIEGNFVNQTNKNSSFIANETNLNFDSCSQNKFLDIFPDNFHKKDFENCKCLNATNASENFFELRTDKTWADKAFFNLKILPNNKNSIGNDTNAQTEKIRNYFDTNLSKMFLHFPSYYVDTKSIEEPIKKNIISESFELNMDTRIYSKLEFSTIDFNEHYSIYDQDTFSRFDKLHFDNRESLSYFRNQKNEKEFIDLDITLSNRVINTDRAVLRYDQFLMKSIDYFYYMILILYFFNTFYNAFRVDVYLSQKCFYKNPVIKNKILDEIDKRLSNLFYLKSIGDKSSNEENNQNEISKIGENTPGRDKDIIKEDKDKQINIEMNVRNNESEFGNNEIDDDDKQKENIIKANSILQNKISNYEPNIENVQGESDRKIRKNLFFYNFIEYVYLKLTYFFCWNNNIQKKENIVKNSIDLTDYYMDVNFYIKNMIELDMIKKLIFGNDKNLLNIFSNFKPSLKTEYSETYEKRLNDLYSSKISENDLKDYLDGVKNTKSNKEFLNELKFFN